MHYSSYRKTFEPVREKNKTIWVLTRSDTNQHVQSRKQARSLKFQISEEEGLYYTCSENTGADLLRGYREIGLRLCFRICKFLVFSCGGHTPRRSILYQQRTINRLNNSPCLAVPCLSLPYLANLTLLPYLTSPHLTLDRH